MARVLETETRTFNERRAEFLRGHEGKFVLIVGHEVCGFFPTRDEALAEGYARFGGRAFFTRQVVVDERPAVFASNLIRPAPE